MKVHSSETESWDFFLIGRADDICMVWILRISIVLLTMPGVGIGPMPLFRILYWAVISWNFVLLTQVVISVGLLTETQRGTGCKT